MDEFNHDSVPTIMSGCMLSMKFTNWGCLFLRDWQFIFTMRSGRLIPPFLNNFFCGEEVCTGVGSDVIEVGLSIFNSDNPA